MNQRHVVYEPQCETLQNKSRPEDHGWIIGAYSPGTKRPDISVQGPDHGPSGLSAIRATTHPTDVRLSTAPARFSQMENRRSQARVNH